MQFYNFFELLFPKYGLLTCVCFLLQIYVFCSWHASKVEEYLRSSRWNVRDLKSSASSDPFSDFPPKVFIIRRDNVSNAGDALREIHDEVLHFH